MLQKYDLRPYQQRTVTAFYERAVVQAVLPMGAGKTVAALTAIAELIDNGEIRCALVLAPKKVAQLVWPAEVGEWEHLKHLRVAFVSGTPVARCNALMREADVYVVGIDNTQWMVDWLAGLNDPGNAMFDCLVIDESSRLKNPFSKRARALMRIRKRFKNVWMLTGTPRPNGYEDQFRPLALLTDNKLWGTAYKDFRTWRMRHFMPTDYEQRNWVIRPEHEADIVRRINQVTVTIADEEMPELPELSTIVHWIDLPPGARRAYDDMERKLVAEIRTRGISAVSAGVAAGKIAQAANGYMYADGHKDVEPLHYEKYELLVELLEDLDEPALIAYDFKEGLRRLLELYPGLPFLGAGTSDYQAAAYEANWNRGLAHRLALHPASAGHGLNLQHGGSQMFWPEMTWSSELYDQTIKRFHRPGQKKPCFVHLILARDTIDEEKYNRVVKKMADQDAFKRLLEKV